jgi:hypothetical protein
MRTLETLATLLVGLVIVYWAPTSVTPVRAFETVAPQTTSALDGLICAQKDRPKINDGGRLWLLGDPSESLLGREPIKV